MFRDAALVAGKDLRLEWRSRVTTNQVMPFALLVLVLFAFALDPDRRILVEATPGLFWVAVLFSAAPRHPAGIRRRVGRRRRATRCGCPGSTRRHLPRQSRGHRRAAPRARGACSASASPLLYGAHLGGPVLLVLTCLAATTGLAAAGSLYGVLAAGLRVRETLLPVLLLPVVAPVLIGATQAFEAGFRGTPAEVGGGSVSSPFRADVHRSRLVRLRPSPGGSVTPDPTGSKLAAGTETATSGFCGSIRMARRRGRARVIGTLAARRAGRPRVVRARAVAL